MRALGLLVCGLMLACKATPTCTETSEPKPVDQGLVAYLSLASSLHHEADLAESSNDAPAALARLERLLAEKPPGSYPEIREVRADTLARAGELALKTGALDRSAGYLERGLAEVPEENYYRGRLYEVTGNLREAESKQLEANGQLPEAETKKHEAIEALERAVHIQEAVIERATAESAKPTRTAR